MGAITISGIEVDTEDIDLLVRHSGLWDLDNLVKADEVMLSELSQDDPIRPYWIHRSNTHKMARDIAEWCFENGIPTVDLPRKGRDRTQGLYALEKCRELEKKVREQSLELKGLMTNYTDFAMPILRRINDHTDKKSKQYKYK